jgi:alpha-L-fucosidase
LSNTTIAAVLLGMGLAPLSLAQPIERVPGGTPTPQQLAWQDLEYGMFCHFGMNTFTDREWGDGTEDPGLFNPTALDAQQWVLAAKSAGMKYLVFTAKHHDGFCLWPSAYTEHSVKNSRWRGGGGDVVREVADACHRHGIKFGVYLSPWDRHEPSYADEAAYDRYYMNQLRELLTNYGEVTEVWHDGAGGAGHTYDWNGYYRLIKSLQPDALTAIAGPSDIRWVGNEDGLAPDMLWNVHPPWGDAVEPYWWPSECDVPIRDGWFWHPDNEHTIKSLDHLLDIYHRSVGHGANLLLNVAPDRRGLLPEADVARIQEMWAVLQRDYATNLLRGKPIRSLAGGDVQPAQGATDGDLETWWQAAEGVTKACIEVDLGGQVEFDRVVIQEAIQLGQHVKQFRLACRLDGRWRTVARGTTVGHKRIAIFAPVTADRIRLHIESVAGPLTVREMRLFRGQWRPKP